MTTETTPTDDSCQVERNCEIHWLPGVKADPAYGAPPEKRRRVCARKGCRRWWVSSTANEAVKLCADCSPWNPAGA